MIHNIKQIQQDPVTGAPITPFTVMLAYMGNLNNSLPKYNVKSRVTVAIKCNGLGNVNLRGLGGFRPRMLIKMDLTK